MTVEDVLTESRRLGIVLEAHGSTLRYRAPQGMLSPELKDALRHHKAQILALLRRQPERPVGDGQPPPLDRPPQTRAELARLIDYLANPAESARLPDYAATACVCPTPNGPTGPDRCSVCELPLICPVCGLCRGCKLILRFTPGRGPYG